MFGRLSETWKKMIVYIHIAVANVNDTWRPLLFKYWSNDEKRGTNLIPQPHLNPRPHPVSRS